MRYIASLVTVIVPAVVMAQSTQPAPPTAQATQVTTIEWRLRAGAPEGLQEWLDAQPSYRERRLLIAKRAIENEKAQHDGLVTRLEEEIRNLQKQKAPTRRARGSMGTYENVPDEQWARQRSKQVADLKKRVQNVKADWPARLTTLEEQYKTLAADTLSLVVPPLAARLHAYGTIEDALEVQQVIDNKTLTVQYRTIGLWIRGMDTTGVVDGKAVNIPHNLLITKTESYVDVVGAKRTIFVAEPCDYTHWVEVVNEPTPKQ